MQISDRNQLKNLSKYVNNIFHLVYLHRARPEARNSDLSLGPARPEAWIFNTGPARGPKIEFKHGPARPDFQKSRPEQPLLDMF